MGHGLYGGEIISINKTHGITLYGSTGDYDIILRPLCNDDLPLLYKWCIECSLTSLGSKGNRSSTGGNSPAATRSASMGASEYLPVAAAGASSEGGAAVASMAGASSEGASVDSGAVGSAGACGAQAAITPPAVVITDRCKNLRRLILDLIFTLSLHWAAKTRFE